MGDGNLFTRAVVLLLVLILTIAMSGCVEEETNQTQTPEIIVFHITIHNELALTFALLTRDLLLLNYGKLHE